MPFLRAVVPESADSRKHRLAAEKTRRGERSAKYDRTHGGASLDVELANVLRDLGVDIFSEPRDRILRLVPERCEGRRVDGFSERALAFLKENFNTEQVEGPRGKLLLHFTTGGSPEMSFLDEVAERCDGIPRKQVKEVYDAIVRVVHRGLRKERRAKLPELGIFNLRYRPARKAGVKDDPFHKGQKMKIKAKEASNKVTFRPIKDLKDYVKEKVEVKKPKSE